MSRILFYILTDSFITFVKTIWIDVLTIAVVLFLGFLKWYVTKFSFKDNIITLSSGVFTHKSTTINISKVSYIKITEPFILSYFNISYISFYFMSRKKNCNINVLIDKRVAAHILKSTLINMENGYNTSLINKIIISMKNSNLLTILFLSLTYGYTTLSYTGAMKNKDILNEVYKATNIKITFSIKNILFCLFLLTISYFIIVLYNLLVYIRYKLHFNDKYIALSYGFLNKNTSIINTDYIKLHKFKQNIFASLLKCFTLSIYVDYKRSFKQFYLYSIPNILVEPLLNMKNIKKYNNEKMSIIGKVFLPIITIIAISFLYNNLHFNDYLYFFILFLLTVNIIQHIILYLTLNIYEYRGSLILKSFSLLSLNIKLSNTNSISSYKVTNSIFYRFNKKQNLYITLCKSNSTNFKLKHLKNYYVNYIINILN